MRKSFVHLLVAVGVAVATLMVPLTAHAAGPLCYVKPLGDGSVDGTSWANAYTLPLALADSGCTEIWVAMGLYKPGLAASDTFYVAPGERLYGGFDGTETEFNQRDWTLNPTILTGDIDNNDTTTGNVVLDSNDINGTNSYHVLWLEGVSAPALPSNTGLDGFTVTGGSATGSSYPNSYFGGGMLCWGDGAGSECSPHLQNLVFSGNRATVNGGALDFQLYNSGAGNAVIEKVTFRGNRATSYGGAIFNNAQGGTGDHALHNVTFTNNHAQLGGAFYNAGDYGGHADPSLANVTFDNNTSSSDGGAFYNTGYEGHADPAFVNATFSSNTAGGWGGAIYDYTGHSSGSPGEASPQIELSTFSGNNANLGGAFSSYGTGGTCLPLIINSIFWGNSATLAGTEFYNYNCTPSVDHSIVQYSFGSGLGWNTNVGSDAGGNLDADPLLASLADNGGYTETRLIGAGSPAIDTGTNTPCFGSDQRLGIRPVDGDGNGTFTCDIGAVEYLPGHIFADMPVTGKEWMEPWVDAFYFAGVTTGCGSGPLIYCPESTVTRAAMAVFLLRAKYGLGYTPPPATHNFADMPVAGKEWMEPWVDELYAEGITSGCGVSPLRYCPENPVTRAAMAVFLLRALEGSSYVPPATVHSFSDMPVAGKEWMEPFVDEFYARGITTGCGAAPLIYCPENSVTRAAMAVFIDRAYGLYP